MDTFDHFNVIGRLSLCLAPGTAPSVLTQALRTLKTMLHRDGSGDIFSEHYRQVVMQRFAGEIFERCEEIALEPASTQEMFHLSVDITEKYLK